MGMEHVGSVDELVAQDASRGAALKGREGSLTPSDMLQVFPVVKVAVLHEGVAVGCFVRAENVRVGQPLPSVSGIIVV